MTRADWQFLDADSEERALFSDLSNTLQAMESEPFAPPNTFRQVHRIRREGRTWYLKWFKRTQGKNRWRNRMTPPHCSLDGAREAGVAAALRERGFGTARPVAVGRRGPESFYLCAEVAGVPIVERLRDGTLDPELEARVVELCVRVARSGVALVDLSADHVYVDSSGDLTIIDLHNGKVGTTDAKVARRILRRFARSVRDVAVPRRRAMRFALRYLRGLELPRARRRDILRRLPPWDTHDRYDTSRSVGYRDRNRKRARRELEMFDAVWPGRAGDTVLDCPCGAGRLAAAVHAGGGVWHGADRSRSMLDRTRELLGEAAHLVQADAAQLPFGDDAFDGVITFRFLHHLPPATAAQVVAEACRVARRFVVVTTFSPVSTHELRRRLDHRIAGRARTRWSVGTRILDAWFAKAGFRPVKRDKHGMLRDLQISAYEADC